jgi:hypothetical protein
MNSQSTYLHAAGGERDFSATQTRCFEVQKRCHLSQG